MSNVNVREQAVASLAATLVPASSTEMLTVDVRGMKRLFVVITASVAAMTAVLVKAAAIKDGTLVTVATSGADYTTPNAIMLAASGDPIALSAASAWFLLDVTGMAEVAIFATTDAGAGKLAIQAGAGLA